MTFVVLALLALLLVQHVRHRRALDELLACAEFEDEPIVVEYVDDGDALVARGQA